MTDLGTALVALIEPHPGQARAFNRWYEGDHYYSAVMAGPGVMAGGRWVATRAAKAARIGDGRFGDAVGASFLATYWVEQGGQARWDDWVPGRMAELVAQERMFAGRDHVHTAIYEPCWAVRSPAGPPVEFALDRHYAGLLVLAVDRQRQPVGQQADLGQRLWHQTRRKAAGGQRHDRGRIAAAPQHRTQRLHPGQHGERGERGGRFDRFRVFARRNRAAPGAGPRGLGLRGAGMFTMDPGEFQRHRHHACLD